MPPKGRLLNECRSAIYTIELRLYGTVIEAAEKSGVRVVRAFPRPASKLVNSCHHERVQPARDLFFRLFQQPAQQEAGSIAMNFGVCTVILPVNHLPSLALERFSGVTFASLAHLISKPVRIEVRHARRHQRRTEAA